ncbi:hypothetical protein SERLA73DRAFT_191376 [Serpula lacrymans var. lacrymans S7.3]|uniref:Fatty acid hydroxylase domain-containing protein n=1 Tax=Serpula lacrymans var. lacrymans (strain S7.3) TaxID=936435 RepID=F8QHF2_SERL3|nr:hypothetical protein SERLA73DRAFT_191376 [Serpula lacrymans var. lacrymans S7.3]
MYTGDRCTILFQLSSDIAQRHTRLCPSSRCPSSCLLAALFFFHLLDISGWKWLDRYRIHESAEVKSRNLASRWDVVWAVVLQHSVQTMLGIFWLTDAPPYTLSGHQEAMSTIGRILVSIIHRTIGDEAGQDFLESRGAGIVQWLYWWGIPMAQLFFAMFVIDTWQYFLHRLMHTNKFLYKHLHSVHHRLYVPYAFGALYNHPVEGFLLDTMGAMVAEYLSCLTIRQSILLFAFSTCKTVDDHCGYNFPFDPLQILSTNNADYHDIHHQTIGIKSNFSQPFFVHWDTLLGTRMTRKDIETRRNKTKTKTT